MAASARNPQTQSPSSSSSSSSLRPRWNYDVFLSFRGEDSRRTYIDHLYTALIQAGIFTFRDDGGIQRGKSIGCELKKAIKESRISIIVFSNNYAHSSSCLDELAEIMECKKTIDQLVLPVFYDVEPSVVRKQTDNYGNALAQHEGRFVGERERVERWRAALTEAANLCGFTSQDRHSPCPSSVSSIGPDSRLLPASISSLFSLRMLNLSNRNLSDGDITAGLWTFMYLTRGDIPDWFSHQTMESSISFDIPSYAENKFLGMTLWLVYEAKEHGHVMSHSPEAIVMNRTIGVELRHLFPLGYGP
ncbi:hypothetical protein LguiA_033899 [Lonicera macranthoides]